MHERLLSRSRRAVVRAWIVYIILWLAVLAAGAYIGWRYDRLQLGFEIGAGVLCFCLLYSLFVAPWYLMRKLPLCGPEYADTVRRIEQLLVPIYQKAAIRKHPKVYIVPTEHCNAFACGVFGDSRRIGVTVGILRVLNDEELSAVLAHEVSHIKRKDVLFSAFWVAFIALTQVAATILFYIGAGLALSRDRRRKDDGGQLLGVIAMLFAIVAGVVSIVLMQIAMRTDERRREFRADMDSSLWTNNPLAMASALQKIEPLPTALWTQQTALAPAFSFDPIHRTGLWEKLFQTHPSTKRRIKRLRKLAATMGAVLPDNDSSFSI